MLCFSIKVAGRKHHQNVHMYEIGLGDKDEVTSRGWKMRTLTSLLKEMGDEGVGALKIRYTPSKMHIG